MTESTTSRRNVLLGMGAAAGLAACGRRSLGGADGALGVAVVGIGNLTMDQVLPALGKTENCYLAGLVSGSRDKLRNIGSRFGVPESAQHSYDDFDRIAENPDIDFVYILLPNALHDALPI